MLAGAPVPAPAYAPLALVRARAARCHRLRQPPMRCASVTAASGELSQPARLAAASAASMSPAAASARDSARLSVCSSHAGTAPPDRALATNCAATSARPSARLSHAATRQATVLDQLVRAHPEDGVQLLEPAARLAQLMMLQVHPGQCGECGGMGCWPCGRCPSPARAAVACRPARRRGPAGRARPRPARDGRGSATRSCSSPGRGCGGHPRIEDAWLPRRNGPTTARQLRGRTARGRGFPGAGRARRPGSC